MRAFTAGDAYGVQFSTANPTTGAAANASATPTVRLFRNGTHDAAVSFTVTNPETGLYRATTTIPAGYVAGDRLEVVVSATVGGVAGVEVVERFKLTGPNFAATAIAADVQSMAAGVITSTVIATDAIGALELSSAAAQEVVDAVLARNLGGGADGGRTVRDALRFLRNRRAISGGTLTVFAEDDTTPAFTAAIVATAGANPITEIDPA